MLIIEICLREIHWNLELKKNNKKRLQHNWLKKEIKNFLTTSVMYSPDLNKKYLPFFKKKEIKSYKMKDHL